MDRIESLENEIWKPIIDLKNNLDYSYLYKINNYGEVVDIKKNIIIKYRYNQDGYKVLSLRYNNINTFQYTVHRLLMYAFKPEKFEHKLIVRHLDDNRKNNDLNNLEWGTAVDNTNDAVKNNKLKVRVREVDMYSMNGMFIKSFKTVSEAARYINCDVGSVYKCCTKERSYVNERRFVFRGEKLHQIKGRGIKTVLKLTINDEIIAKYSSPIDAQKHTGVNRKDIATVCRTKRGTAGGWIWRYEE